MRILYISHSFPIPGRPLSNVGGMQRVAVDLHQALARRPDVALRTISLETSWRATGIRTGPFLLSLLRRLPAAVARDGIETVLFSSMVTAAVAPLVAGRVSRRGAVLGAIAVGRDLTLPNVLYQRHVPRVLANLDVVLPISRATAEAALSRGAAAGNVHVVPCGIDLPAALGTIEEQRAGERDRLLDALRRRGHTVPTDAFLLLSVGRHQERKGFHWFVDAVMPRLPPDTVYLLAGAGPMTPVIERLITERGLGPRAILLGQVSEDLLQLLYRGSDVFVMPNIPVPGDIEGFGVVMLEAGAAGLPVVAAQLEGIRDVIAPGRNGILVPPADAEAFARAINGYRDPLTLAHSRESAAAHVRATFAWDTVVERYLEIFRTRLT